MSLIDEINESWGWIGLRAEEVVCENDFGNLIIRDVESCYWRVCPEELTCEVVAKDRAELDKVSRDQEFLEDWYMTALVEQANERCGPLTEGRKYCLKIPAVLGGEYGGDNLAIVPQVELVRFSGDIAKQIKDLPDGAHVELKMGD